MKGRKCNGCPYVDVIRAQDGFTFLGCRYSPYNGKMVSEIKKCPREEKWMEAETSKGFIRVSDALYDLYGKDPRRLWSFKDLEEWLRSIKQVDISYLENAANTKEDGWLERNKDRILRAGLEGREVEFRIGGRIFAIREKAQ